MVLLMCVFVGAQQNKNLRVVTKDLKAGLLDPETGKVVCESVLKLPSSSCRWNLGEGTRGQTSATFNMNSSFFFLAQEADCPSYATPRTLLLDVMGPFESANGCAVSCRPLQQINTTAYIDTMNIDWDHTCNVVALNPEQHNDSVIYRVLQISEYDGQVRPQVVYKQEEKDCKDCWRKVQGVGALDQGNFTSVWNPELNCGDSCVFYSLEQQYQAGAPVLPRAFVGRSFRTGLLMANVSDPFNLLTLTWVSWLQDYNTFNQFIGIGVCCSESYCHADCAGLDGHMVLVSYEPTKQKFRVLSDISKKQDQDTARLGVELSPFFTENGTTKQAYVFHSNTVITFDLVVEDKAIVGAKMVHQSPPIGFGDLQMWANAE